MNLNKLVFVLGILFLLAPFAYAQIEIKEYVNDYASVINESYKTELDDLLKTIKDSGVAEYSIVTVKSLEGKAIESYSLELAQGNLGDTEKNNGLLLLVAVDDRQYRFEVGRGIESILNDAKIGRIGRYYLVPNLQNNEYGKGILEASLAVKSTLLGENESEYYVSEDKGDSSGFITFIIMLSLIIGFNIFINVMARKKKKKYFDAATGAIILFGGFGRGGSGGGFGGFGGGGFGGGGVSGRF
jgi:uncharacterized protein